MKESLRQQFQRLALRLNELDASLADPAVASDMKRYRALTREHAEAAGLVEDFKRYEQRERDLASAQELRADPDMAAVRGVYTGQDLDQCRLARPVVPEQAVNLAVPDGETYVVESTHATKGLADPVDDEVRSGRIHSHARAPLWAHCNPQSFRYPSI